VLFAIHFFFNVICVLYSGEALDCELTWDVRRDIAYLGVL
jgi:hypothetical protein